MTDVHVLTRLLVDLVRLLVLLGGAFLLLRYFLSHFRAPGPIPVPAEAGPGGGSAVLALRLQACERLTLFLERIHPSNLVMRIGSPGLTAVQLQVLLVKTIREEFEYNFSQQIYLSQQAWELTRNAKEETIALVNHAASTIDGDLPAQELVQRIIDLSVTRGKLAVESALSAIRSEARQMF